MLGISDLPQFYLGSIAPDAVNTGEFAPREVRYAAHLRSRSYDEWKRNIREYRAERERKKDFSESPAFFDGVLLHLYTDIAWDEVVQPLLFEEFRRRGVPDEEFNDRKWSELDAFDSVLTRRPDYSGILSQLEDSRAFAVTTVSPEQLLKWRDMVIAAESGQEEPIFLGIEHIAMTLARTIALMKNG